MMDRSGNTKPAYLRRFFLLGLLMMAFVPASRAAVIWGDVLAYQWQDSVVLEWTTMNEVNNEAFYIHPVPSTILTPIGPINAVSNSSQPTTYRYTVPLSLLTGFSMTSLCVSIEAREFGGWMQMSDTVCLSLTTPTTPVWPGDANSDGVANAQDLLYIGIGNGTTGPARPGATLNWTGQTAPAWADSFASWINYRYADCDGNGTINLIDTLAINQNYGLTHSKAEVVTSGGVPLTLVYPDSVNSLDTVTVEVWLGTAGTPVPNGYGLAFELHYDPQQVDSGKLWLAPSTSWFGTPGQDMADMRRNFHNDGRLDVAITRTDGANRSGYGKVAEIGIVLVDNLGRTSFDAALDLSAKYALLLDNEGNRVQVEVLQATEEEFSQAPVVRVWPNPASENIHLELSGGEKVHSLEILDLQGRVLLKENVIGSESELDVMGLAEGMYLLKMNGRRSSTVKRLVVARGNR